MNFSMSKTATIEPTSSTFTNLVSITSTGLNVLTTTTSTSTTTGALVVSGGAGFAGAVFIGGNTRVTATTASTSTTTGALVVSGGAGFAGSLNVGGNIILGAIGSPLYTGFVVANFK